MKSRSRNFLLILTVIVSGIITLVMSSKPFDLWDTMIGLILITILLRYDLIHGMQVSDRLSLSVAWGICITIATGIWHNQLYEYLQRNSQRALSLDELSFAIWIVASLLIFSLVNFMYKRIEIFATEGNFFAKFGAIIGFAVHCFILVPIKIVIFGVIIVKFFAWLGLDLAEKWAPVLDTKALNSYFGFVGGITPFSSWHNFKLYFKITLLGAIPGAAIMLLSMIVEETVKDVPKKLSIRIKTGKILNWHGNIASALLVGIAVLIFLNKLSLPFPKWLQLSTLICFGLTIGFDRFKYGHLGEKYGMIPIFGKKDTLKHLIHDLSSKENWQEFATGIFMLEEELQKSEDELDKILSFGKRKQSPVT